jgi:hypothetical protein
MPVGYKNVIRDDSAETEEGYRSVYEVWENKQGVLYRVIDSNESDCDGRHSSHTEQKLVDGNWLTVNQSQRDYRAESMGY